MKVVFESWSDAERFFEQFAGLEIFSTNCSDGVVTTSAPEAAVRGCLKAMAEQGVQLNPVIEKEAWEE